MSAGLPWSRLFRLILSPGVAHSPNERLTDRERRCVTPITTYDDMLNIYPSSPSGVRFSQSRRIGSFIPGNTPDQFQFAIFHSIIENLIDIIEKKQGRSFIYPSNSFYKSCLLLYYNFAPILCAKIFWLVGAAHKQQQQSIATTINNNNNNPPPSCAW